MRIKAIARYLLEALVDGLLGKPRSSATAPGETFDRAIDDIHRRFDAARPHTPTEPHDPAMCDRCTHGVCSGYGPPVNRNASTARTGRPKPDTLR